jgi:hypothetical protein
MTRDEWIKVQEALKRLGLYLGRIDGIAGPMTVGAVMVFQGDAGLTRDGIVGPVTWRALFSEELPEPSPGKFFEGEHRPLGPDDLDDVAARLGIEPAALKAVIAVEASNKAFDLRDRPTVLYEPHVAFRLTDGVVQATLGRAKLAYKTPGTLKYPSSPEARYKQITRAAEIAGDEIAASSASWGLGQIMGFNYRSAGFGSAVELVKAFADSAVNQVTGMAAFILNNAALHHALIRRDWSAFAESYNGRAYRRNGYDKKMALAYQEALQ